MARRGNPAALGVRAAVRADGSGAGHAAYGDCRAAVDAVRLDARRTAALRGADRVRCGPFAGKEIGQGTPDGTDAEGSTDSFSVLLEISRALGFALQLLAPHQFGLRGLFRAADDRCLYLAIARIDRSDDAVRRD